MIGTQRTIPWLHFSILAGALIALAVGSLALAQSASSPAATSPVAGSRVEDGKRITPDGWFALSDVHHPALPREITEAFVIPIHGDISEATADSVQRKILQANGGGAQLVIFDMNTPGGEMSAMMRITQLIEQDLRNTYTVAFVNDRAYSAGAIISLACDEIDMAPSAIIGDAMPVNVGPTGYVPLPAPERAKIESATRGEIRALAQRKGYSPTLCEGLISMELEIWLIRNRASGELQYVYADAWRDKVASAAATAPTGSQWQFVRQVKSPRELLTMTSHEAIDLGIARHIFADSNALTAQFNVRNAPEVLRDTWSERLAAFLASPWAVGVLLFVGLICIYLEAHTPGFGVAGTAALIAFALLFGARYLSGLAQWWEIALFGIGIVLILVELFVIPGHGVAGSVGGALCILAVLAMLVPSRPGKVPWPVTPLDWQLFTHGILAVAGAVLASTMAMLLLARHLPKVPIAGRLFLAPPKMVTTPPAPEGSPILSVRPGMTGEVRQICRPVGKVMVAGLLLDAIAEGAYLNAGTAIVVLRNEGNRVVVAEKTAGGVA